MPQDKKKDKEYLTLVVAIIGAIATIAAAYFSYSAGKETILIPIRATQTAEARQPPVIQTVTTSISINTIQGKGDAVIEVPHVIQVPHEIFIKGTASISNNLYVYLIVYDGVAEYVQPDVIQTANDGFTGYCYLGKKDDPGSINKRYTVFAVVTDQKHGSYTPLDRKTVKAISHPVEFYRIR